LVWSLRICCTPDCAAVMSRLVVMNQPGFQKPRMPTTIRMTATSAPTTPRMRPIDFLEPVSVDEYGVNCWLGSYWPGC
jgi:hypothetical protein